MHLQQSHLLQQQLPTAQHRVVPPANRPPKMPLQKQTQVATQLQAQQVLLPRSAQLTHQLQVMPLQQLRVAARQQQESLEQMVAPQQRQASPVHQLLPMPPQLKLVGVRLHQVSLVSLLPLQQRLVAARQQQVSLEQMVEPQR
mmetsp:Transcript_99847/g.321831  ORF Transcript_99847/g.321831 Transcript_99847/m.321831 type:complete len:143 (-) Transcript_99847:354-782(-)